MTDEQRGQNRPAIPTVLVVDDSTAVRRIICRALAEAGYRAVEASDGLTALEACRSDRPDLVLLDIDMPVMDGHATLREMRADADLCSVPVLFLMARPGGSEVAAGVELGTQSYLPKPCDPGELKLRVAMALRTKAAEDALARHARDANELSTTDLETGIGNRRLMETRILELAATHGPAAVATVIKFGVDDFEAVNDTFGHAVGAMVLRIVAGRLRNAVVDEHVLLCRWDSEEFLAVGVGLDATEASALAERLRYAVSITPFAAASDLVIPITLSAGCATGALGVYGAVLEAASVALFEAKRAGHNQQRAAH